MARPKGQKKLGGRKKGTPNKITAALKDMILEAAELAGGEGGTVAYLRIQALTNPGPFMTLLGKVLPTQLTGDKDNPVQVKVESDAKFGEVVGLLEDASRAKQGDIGGSSDVDQASEAAATNA